MDTVIADPFYREVPLYLETTLAELLVVKHPTSWVEFELGLSDEASFLSRFYRTDAGLRLEQPEVFKEVFFSAYRFVPGMEALLTELKRTQPLWVLSNYSPWFQVARERLGLDRFFDGYCVSCNTGYRKPSRESYLAVTAQTGESNYLLIDDRQPNITGAQAAGFEGILFTDADALRSKLLSRGIVGRA